MKGFLRWSLTKYLPGLTSYHDPPDQVAGITGVSQWCLAEMDFNTSVEPLPDQLSGLSI
jgi:hypothetical protein